MDLDQINALRTGIETSEKCYTTGILSIQYLAVHVKCVKLSGCGLEIFLNCKLIRL